MINEHILKDFGARIRQLRVDKDMSQEKLSFATGFHRTYIGMTERGERNISLTNIAVYAKVFEMTISELMDFKSINPEHNHNSYKLKSEE